MKQVSVQCGLCRHDMRPSFLSCPQSLNVASFLVFELTVTDGQTGVMHGLVYHAICLFTLPAYAG